MTHEERIKERIKAMVTRRRAGALLSQLAVVALYALFCAALGPWPAAGAIVAGWVLAKLIVRGMDAAAEDADRDYRREAAEKEKA